MRLDGAVVRCQPASHAEPKSKNGKNDATKEGKTVVKLPIRVTNLESQKQLPDTLHAKAKVNFYCPHTFCGQIFQIPLYHTALDVSSYCLPGVVDAKQRF